MSQYCPVPLKHDALVHSSLWCVYTASNIVWHCHALGKKKAAEYSTNCSYKHPGPLPSQLPSAHGSDKDVFLQPPDRELAAFVPREPTTGGHSFVSMLIITNHPPGGEVWHIFVTVVIRATTDYHQDIKLTRQYEWADDSLERSKALCRNFGRIFFKRHWSSSFHDSCNQDASLTEQMPQKNFSMKRRKLDFFRLLHPDDTNWKHPTTNLNEKKMRNQVCFD